MLQLFCGQHTEHIALVFRVGIASVQFEFAVVTGQDGRVVTGANSIESKSKRLLEQSRKLDALVASHARIRCAARFVFGNEIVDDFFFELFAEIPDIVRNAENVGCALRIHAVFDCAATARTGSKRAGHARKG